MPEVANWLRMCAVQEGLDHVELLRNELYCQFCRLKNPCPPTNAIVQPVPLSTTPLKKTTPRKGEVIVIPDDDSDEGNEPAAELAAIKVTSRWAGTQPKRTIANNERLIKARQEEDRNTFSNVHRDAGSAPVSSQDISAVPKAMPGLKPFNVTVQLIVGRYSIDEEELDDCKTMTWRRFGM